MKTLLLLLLLCPFSSIHAHKLSFFLNHTNVLYEQYVDDGRVNYQALSKNTDALIPAITEMERLRINDLNQLEQKAFWINAYNLLVIKSIVSNYPTTSPLEIDGFFDQQTFLLDGKKLTLNNIEHKAFQAFKDPLMHFAFVCAAQGCPTINKKAYTPNNIELELKEKAITTLNDPAFVLIDEKEQKVGLSFIFKWYKKDFPNDILDFINDHRHERIPLTYKTYYYNYDWKLNEIEVLKNFIAQTDFLLSKYVKNGLVNYEKLKANPKAFEGFISEMEKINCKELTPNEKKAFLINTYNVLVLKSISAQYPVTSPLKIKGFFDEITYKINGRDITLDDLEHKAFYSFHDPLIHFGLVCAAKGCPSINNSAYTPNGIDEELAAKATEMFDNPAFLIEDRASNKVGMSFIFKWNMSHFPPDLIAFINDYKTTKIDDYATIYYYNYNWKLNELKLLTQFLAYTDHFLEQYTKDGIVNYQELHNNPSFFDPIMAEIKAIRFKDLNSKEKKAYLINVYNLLVIKSIAEKYPITSPLDIEGFFDQQSFVINNREMTLDELENKAFYHFDDPLVHFALVCAAKGCPKLNNKAYTPYNVDKELIEKAKETLNDPSFVLIDPENKKVGLSFIFKWYSSHFPSDPIGFINDYRKQKVPQNFTIYHYNYDWKLNTK